MLVLFYFRVHKTTISIRDSNTQVQVFENPFYFNDNYKHSLFMYLLPHLRVLHIYILGTCRERVWLPMELTIRIYS